MEQISQFSPSQTWPISDLRTMKLLVAPRRVQILTLLIEADRTVKEVAAILNLPASRLYYHFNLLERSGLISVIETRKVGGTLEKRYRASALTYRVNPNLIESPGMPDEDQAGHITRTFEDCKYDLIQLASGTEQPVGLQPQMCRTSLYLTFEQANEIIQRLNELHQMNSQQPDGGHEYILLTAFYPALYTTH